MQDSDSMAYSAILSYEFNKIASKENKKNGCNVVASAVMFVSLQQHL